MVWCVVWVWFAFGLGVMVFDVGVRLDGWFRAGSGLGTCVFGCLRFCARFPFVLFWWGVLRVIDKKTRRRHTPGRRSERVANTEREDHAFMQPGRVLGVLPFTRVGVHYQRALCVSHSAQGVAL